MRTYMLARYHQRRAAAIAKLGGKCVKCGTVEQLEFDHIDPKTKSFGIGKMWSLSNDKLQKELEKCQLLCKPCHKEKSDRELELSHGRGLTGKKNCYCPKCKPLKQEYMRGYQRNR